MSRPANLEGLPWPEGEPGPLRSAAGRLRGLAGGFEGAGARLSGAVAPAWSGVASTSYSSTLTRGQDAVTHLAGSLDAAAAAYGDLADTIESAQDDVRRAAERLHEAREAARQARARATEARWEADQAHASAALSPALVTGGAFDPLAAEASAAESRAQTAESDAATAEAEASRVERADAACAGALDGTGMTGGLALSGGAVAHGAKTVWDFVYEVQIKPLNPWHSGYNEGESATVGGAWLSGIMFGTSEWTSRYASQQWMRTVPGYWIREPRYVGPYTRSTPSGGTTRVSGYVRRGVWAGSQEVPDAASRAQWASRAKLFGRAGGAASLLTAGAGQYFDDLDNPNLNTAERSGRIGMQTLTVGGASALGGWGAAAGGAAIGTAICPGVGTVIGGVVGGIAGGALAGGVVDKFNDGLVDLGGDIADGVSDFVGSIDPPDIDLPDVDLPDVDLPEIDLPDVDVTPW